MWQPVRYHGFGPLKNTSIDVSHCSRGKRLFPNCELPREGWGGGRGVGGENYDFQKMPNKHSVTWLQKSSTSHFVAKTVMLFRSDIFAQQVSVPVHTEVFTSTGSNFMHFCQKPVLDRENVNIKKCSLQSGQSGDIWKRNPIVLIGAANRTRWSHANLQVTVVSHGKQRFWAV